MVKSKHYFEVVAVTTVELKWLLCRTNITNASHIDAKKKSRIEKWQI